jgi:hypothetical protein
MTIIRFKQEGLPKLSPTTRAELDALKGRPVDTSDIPELDERFWKRATPSPFFRKLTR